MIKAGVTAGAMLVLALASQAMADSGANGMWLMENGKVTVRISSCGGNLCGTIVGLKKPRDKEGRPKRDKDNPNPGLRNRPVIGLTILNGLSPEGDDRWSGTIYNPDDGNTYDSDVMLVNSRTLKVKGCVAFVCKTKKFTRIN